MLNDGDPTKVVSAYAMLRKVLQEYRLRLGLHLQINDISRELRVSITPVREALNRLNTERLVDSVPNRGYFVKNLDPKEQHDLHETKNALFFHSLKILPKLNDTVSYIRHDPEFSLFEQIEEIYLALCGLTGNQEFRYMAECYCARTFLIRKIDCEINEDANRSFVASITRINLSAVAQDAVHILSAHRERFRMQLPVLLREAAARVMLESNETTDIGSAYTDSGAGQQDRQVTNYVNI